MGILTKIAYKNLKQNKRRTLITVLGIILSAAMLCGLTSLVSSFQNYFYRDAKARNGGWHLSYEVTDQEEIKEILDDPEVKTVFSIEQKGYAKFDNKNTSKPYLFVVALNPNDLTAEKNQEMFPVYLKEGRLPQNENEIILPDHLLNRASEVLQIGQTLSLDIGQRYFIDGYDQNLPSGRLTQIDPLQMDETSLIEELSEVNEHKYTIVGFYSRSDLEPFAAPGYMAITNNDVAALNSNTKADVPGTFTTYFIELNDYKEVGNFIERHDNPLNYKTNSEMLRFLGFSLNDNVTSMLYGLSSIFYILIILASITLISNAFTISLTERVKQFGLLSSIGSSKKQLRKMIYTEALLISFLGLPLGILGGLGGIYITLRVIEDLFFSTIGIYESVGLELYISWPVLVITIALTLITVLISAYLPARKATSVTAIEAIKQSKDINAKPTKVGKLTRKLFGLSGFLATKYYKQSKAKYRSTIVSLALSIILFISASTFTSLAQDSTESMYSQISADFQYTIYPEDLEQEIDFAQIKQDISKIKGVKQVENSFYTTNVFTYDRSTLTNSAVEFFTEEPMYSDSEIEEDVYFSYFQIYYLEDENFRELLETVGLSEAKYQELSETAYYPIVYNKNMYFLNSGNFKEIELFKNNQVINLLKFKEIPNYRMGYLDSEDLNNVKIIYFDLDNDNEKVLDYAEAVISAEEIKLEYFVDELPSNLFDYSFHTKLIFPVSLREKLSSPNFPIQGSFFIDTFEANHYAAVDEISDYNIANSLNGDFNDYYEMQTLNQNMTDIIDIFTYGFIILISLIALTNVLNTITTNINLRARDFSMLRSIGLSEKDFRKMTLFECILYGSRSVLFGLPIALIFSILIQKSFSNMFDKSLFIPWIPIIIAIIVIFIFVYITMLIAMNKVKQANIIETMKRDIT